MDSPYPWLLAGTALGLALTWAGRSVHQRALARRGRPDGESTNAPTSINTSSIGPLSTTTAPSTTTRASRRGDARHRPLKPKSTRPHDPARAAARAAAREKAARVIAAEASRVREAREAALLAASKVHVLVVDDSATIRHRTGRLLERHGYRVTYAIDGMEALLRVASEMPDAVVTDIEMPRMDGLSLVRRLRAEPRTATLPIVMVSSAEARFRDEALGTGVDALLAKPYAADALLAPLARLQGAQQARAATASASTFAPPAGPAMPVPSPSSPTPTPSTF
jgi:CheY-like chemotaxis protein